MVSDGLVLYRDTHPDVLRPGQQRGEFGRAFSSMPVLAMSALLRKCCFDGVQAGQEEWIKSIIYDDFPLELLHARTT